MQGAGGRDGTQEIAQNFWYAFHGGSSWGCVCAIYYNRHLGLKFEADLIHLPRAGAFEITSLGSP
jgi:hypothetical protein